MFTGPQIVSLLTELGITHVVTIPDSTLGQWEDDIRAAAAISYLGVCREGEAWAVAAGLYLGGARPLVMIQCTGLFESGDSLRNALFDYQLPLFAMIGYRSFLSQATLPGDTCLAFTEPVLDAWGLDWVLYDRPEDLPGQLEAIAGQYHRCQEAGVPGVALVAEGRA
ncbi:MAG: hypothetical protein CMJ65_07865 [Planctomycetaceae bacterium]|jgi:sulfopyruvate decarboxylase TPP-binding subunit|nr:hypothetical protein [Planctomycetaceae bacterium]MDP7275268.1 thiamine pyrophosphate-binding protein [Planctomycetaceae bacterium]